MTISLVTEVSQAPVYPTNRHSARERKVLETVKTYVDAEIATIEEAVEEIVVDAEDVTVTVTTETDWTAVPASVLAALDELAARVKVLEGL